MKFWCQRRDDSGPQAEIFAFRGTDKRDADEKAKKRPCPDAQQNTADGEAT